MFPNDDICDLKAAKNAAKRIFEKYSKTSNSFGEGQISSLMRDTYQALNMNVNPDKEDINSLINVMDFNHDGQISLEDIQQLAVKYLCGDVMDMDGNKIQTKNGTRSPLFTNKQIRHLSPPAKLQLQQNTILNKPSLIPINTGADKKINNVSAPFTELNKQKKSFEKTNELYRIESPKSLSSKQLVLISRKNQYMQQAKRLFDASINPQQNAVTMKQVGFLLQKTYEILGRKNYKPDQKDIQLWMRLCDDSGKKKITWPQYEQIFKKMLAREMELM